MTAKEILMLSDPLVKPDEKIIFSYIGDKKLLWQEIMDYLRDCYPEASGVWNYYKDGKQWLFKVVRKKKTVFWGAILEDTFRITFYFGEKAEPVILASELQEKIKHDFLTGQRYGKIRAISIKMNDISDVETVKKLVSLKTKLK
jgi:hypothetical protein